MIIQPVIQPVFQLVTSSVFDPLRAKSGPAPLPAPTTASFTSAQFVPGFTGSISTTKNAARVYARGGLTLWSGYITGTEAKLTSPSDFGDNAGSMEVAINGGAFAAAPNAASVYTLFTGLPHAKRFVEVRWVLAMGDAPYIASSGDVLQVIGQPPALEVMTSKIEVGSDFSVGRYNGATLTNTTGYAPRLQAVSGQTYGSNVGAIRVRGAFNRLVVTLNGPKKIGVSKNGAAPIYYSAPDEAGNPARAIVVPCDGSVSTYNVWDSGNTNSSGGTFAVAGDSFLLDIGARKDMDQYGDSITYGSGPGATPVNTETMIVASAMGFLGSTNGVSGLTIAQMKTLLDSVLPAKVVVSLDVAILAIGGNSAEDGIDVTDQADYSACIDKLLAKAYGKVLCRGILPRPGAETTIAAANAALKLVMDGKANSRLAWIEPVTWTGYETQDGTHPTAAGYLTIAGFAQPAYTAALGL